MPRYYFHIRLAERVIEDHTGRDLPGPEAAHWHAVRLAYQVRFHLPEDDADWALEITDEAGVNHEVFIPSFLRSQWRRPRTQPD
jgi:hypothetical protein